MTERALLRDDVRPRPAAPANPGNAGGGTGLDEVHELRVRIPVSLHRQLLSLKVLRGRSLAETVSLALDQYFAQVKSPPAEERDA